MISSASYAFSGRGNWIAITLSCPYLDSGELTTSMDVFARTSKNFKSVFALTRNFSEILPIENVKTISTKTFPNPS